MNVQELIDKLQSMPKDSPVVMEINDHHSDLDISSTYYKIHKVYESGNFIPTVYLKVELK